MTLVKFNGNNATKSLMPGFNDVFDSIFNDTFFADRVVSRVPSVNISESAESYHIEMASPGLKKEDFKINVDQYVMTVSVEKQQENTMEDRTYNRREYSYNSFVRSFNLPELADTSRIEAAYEDGVLKIDVAKKEEAKSIVRQIEIK